MGVRAGLNTRARRLDVSKARSKSATRLPYLTMSEEVNKGVGQVDDKAAPRHQGQRQVKVKSTRQGQ